MEEADQIERTTPPAPQGADKMVISADGAMVPLRQGEWGEVRTLAVGEVALPKADQEAGHTHHITYFSRLVDAKRFEHLSLVEIQRRGLEHSHALIAADGVYLIPAHHIQSDDWRFTGF
jgi:hypothetical protein